jgi:hypothetical protein
MVLPWHDDYTTNISPDWAAALNDFKDTAIDRYEKSVPTKAALDALTGVFKTATVWVDNPGGLFVHNGTEWVPVALTGQVADGNGGGNLTTGWAASNAPASVTLGEGTWSVAASIAFVLSTAARVTVDALLWNTDINGGIGTNQNFYRGVGSAADVGTASFTAEFTRSVTVTTPTTVQIFRKTSATGGTQATGVEHLIATRIA